MEYLDDIDITEFNAIPTTKECICIMKNDHLCKL
jgi:predicted phosphoadenosine phosphosulfate sulfurtransferase